MMSPTLRLALTITVALCQGGCAVGYVVVRPGAEPDSAAHADWSALHFTIEGDERDRCVAERLLLERYGVLYVRSGARAEGAFHLAVSRAHVPPNKMLRALGMVSYFTFAAIPGYASDTVVVTYTLYAPEGSSFVGTGRDSERIVSWLPFALLAPNAIRGFGGRLFDEADLRRFDAATALAGRFLSSAEPFVDARQGRVAGALQ